MSESGHADRGVETPPTLEARERPGLPVSSDPKILTLRRERDKVEYPPGKQG